MNAAPITEAMRALARTIGCGVLFAAALILVGNWLGIYVYVGATHQLKIFTEGSIHRLTYCHYLTPWGIKTPTAFPPILDDSRPTPMVFYSLDSRNCPRILRLRRPPVLCRPALAAARPR
jgi:hypothetical protein